MSKKKITLCLVGTGGIAHVHGKALNLCQDVDLKVYNRTRSKAEKFADTFKVSEIIDSLDDVFLRPDIDAVDICVTHDMHLDLCIKAFENNKHVLLEKPMANTLKDADKMIDAAKKANKIFAVSENFRFEPAILKAKEIIDSGDIGKPFMITINDYFWMAELTTKTPLCDWRRKLEGNAGGVLFDRGVHFTALLNYLGGQVDSVYARCMNPQKFWEGDETSILVCTHKNGIITNYIQSWNILGFPERQIPRFAVWGTEGSIIENPQFRIPGHLQYELGALKITSRKNKQYSGQIATYDYIAGKAWLENLWNMKMPENMLKDMVRLGTDWFVEDEYPNYDVYHASVSDFIDSVRNNKQPHVTGKAARDDIAVVFAAYESNKKNAVIKI